MIGPNNNLKLYFSTKVAYRNLKEDQLLTNDYVRTLPMIKWLEENVGPMAETKPGDMFSGDGWEIHVEYRSCEYEYNFIPKPYVSLTKAIAASKVTEFVMLWS